MAGYTKRLKLKKPSQSDVVNINDLNGNMDIVDASFVNLKNETDDKIQVLANIMEGQIADYYTVEETSYIEEVGNGCKGADVLMVGGMSQVWNQRVRFGNLYPPDPYFIENGDGSFTVKNGANAYYQPYKDHIFSVISGHKYYAKMNHGIDGTLYLRIDNETDGIWISGIDTPRIFTANFTDMKNIYIRALNYSGDDVIVKPRIVDLTQMFGAGNEPTSVDDERIRLLEMELEEHRDYDEGTIISASVSNIESRGMNLWDEEWRNGAYIIEFGTFVELQYRICNKNLIKVEPNTTYYFYCGSISTINDIIYYGRNGEYIGYKTDRRGGSFSFTTPNGCEYINFGCWENYGTTYKNNIAIIKGTGGTYKPYKKPSSIAFPSAIASQMHGINDSVYDKVELMPRVYQNMNGVDLGSLKWSYNGVIFSATVIDIKPPSTDAERNKGLLSKEYFPDSQVSIGASMTEKSMLKRDTTIFVKDSRYTSTQDFREAVSGVILHYEAVEGGADYEAVLMEKKTEILNTEGFEWTYNSEFDYMQTTNAIDTALGTRNIAVLANVAFSISATNNGRLRLFGTGFTNPVDFKTAIGENLIYELATPQILDVTDLVDDIFFLVEAGGTITYKTENDDLHIPVPHKVKYLRKLSEVV